MTPSLSSSTNYQDDASHQGSEERRPTTPSIEPKLAALQSHRHNSNVSESSEEPPPLPPKPLIPNTVPIQRPRSYDRSPSVSASARSSSPAPANEGADESIQLIIRSFAPHIAVHVSVDVEDFLASKGLEEDFSSLLQPFGEHIQGKVIIRDSVGASKTWNDFGVRLVRLRPEQPQLRRQGSRQKKTRSIQAERLKPPSAQYEQQNDTSLEASASAEGFLGSQLDLQDPQHGGQSDFGSSKASGTRASLYLSYLIKMLSSTPSSPYETFRHPVACIIAVTSHDDDPIKTFHDLYASTTGKSKQMPEWIGSGYLRYYVLIHDEYRDDITKSTALFDAMKRSFGLHCHLLRLKSSPCSPDELDKVKVPAQGWMPEGFEKDKAVDRNVAPGSAQYESAPITMPKLEKLGEYIFESEANAIRAFIREMVTQSVVPFMEKRITTWNDQVASRRRGISGRFISLSKKWTGFSANRSGSSSSNGSPSPSGSSFDSTRGFYPPETPEATMRQLADHAFMLRDWRLAYNIYDLLRSDFNNDKAWSYYAAANEMAAISLLLLHPTNSSRFRADTVEQLLDNALYSYLTRCSLPSGAIRCGCLAMELLKGRGPASSGDAARLGRKLLELGLLSPTLQVLFVERIADCYASQFSSNPIMLGARDRESAFWNVLAADSWLRVGQPIEAQRCLRSATSIYQQMGPRRLPLPFSSMETLWKDLSQTSNATQDLISFADQDISTETGIGEDRGSTSLEELSNIGRPTSIGNSQGLQHLGADDADTLRMLQARADQKDGFE